MKAHTYTPSGRPRDDVPVHVSLGKSWNCNGVCTAVTLRVCRTAEDGHTIFVLTLTMTEEEAKAVALDMERYAKMSHLD